MDNIKRLLDEIRADPNINTQRFTSKFLNNVGHVFETRGPNAASIYLMKWEERKIKKQAKALECVLEKFGKYPEISNDWALCRYIIKNLDVIIRRGENPC